MNNLWHALSSSRAEWHWVRRHTIKQVPNPWKFQTLAIHFWVQACSHCWLIKVVNSSWTPNKTELSFPGIMTDLVLVDCLLPDSPVKHGYFDEKSEGTPAAGLVISVSNDGIHKSKENLTFISYDSACMSCNVSTGCYLKVSLVPVSWKTWDN